MAAEPKTSENPGLAGYIGLVIILVTIAFGVRAIYSAFLRKSPPVVSLTAYFADNTGNPVTSETSQASRLRIRGQVYQSGQPLKDGNVRVTVSKQDRTFQQSTSLDMKNGQFETDDLAFRSLRPCDHISIVTEVSSPQLSETTTGELYLNMTPPALTLTGEIILSAVIFSFVIVFFVAFTGRKTPAKNRAAIIFSYCVIGIFLALPLLAPVLLLHAFPNAVEAMIGTPAGLVKTHISNQPGGESQWALNIGGNSFKVDVSDACGNSSSAKDNTNGPEQMKTGASHGAINTPNQPGNVEPTQNPPQPTPASPITPATDKPATAGATDAGATDGSPSSADSKGPSSSNNALKENVKNVVKVEGGLLIPLYVIVLSVIGGAINMTRKVPKFQREGEYSEVSLPSSVGKLGKSVLFLAANLRPSKVASTSQPGPSPETQSSKGEQDKTKTATTPSQSGSIEGDAATGPTAAPADSTPKNREQTEEVNANEKGSSVELFPKDKAMEIDSELDQLVKVQVSRNCQTDGTLAQVRALVQKMREIFDSKGADERILGFESFEDWLGTRVSLKELLGSNWRVELLNQYMYLISAPFLAIVAYYMLDLLGLTRQPVLVVISFSVGLISERILSWILGIASGYLRSDTSSQSAST